MFVKAASGFGKSVSFFTILYVCNYLYPSKMEGFLNPSFRFVVLVIIPLKALMEDQLGNCKIWYKWQEITGGAYGGRVSRSW